MPYAQLTSEERFAIYHLKLYGLSHREIGRRLGRHHSTICREMARNGPEDPDDDQDVYWHEAAHQDTLARRHRPKPWLKKSNTRLLRYVERKLQADWSPETIAGCLKLAHPENAQKRVSTETIYRWVYRDAGQGGTLYTFLCRQHKKRRRQGRYGAGRGLIPGRVSIDQRPETVNQRARFGDWEGDTIEGARGGGNLTSHVERKSRYVMVAKIADKTADATASAAIHLFQRIPCALRQTLTLDNGKEFARFKAIEEHTGLTIYFADPYAAWQRGCNENTNGLLRRYFPKGTDFRNVTEKEVALVVKKLNHRPRKCLAYQTPHSVFMKALRGALVS